MFQIKYHNKSISVNIPLINEIKFQFRFGFKQKFLNFLVQLIPFLSRPPIFIG